MAKEKPRAKRRGRWLIEQTRHNDRWQELLQRLKEIPYALRPRPNSGNMGLDIAFLFFFATLQLSIIPEIFGRFVNFDLVTPWIVLIIVHQTWVRATILIFVAAMIIETHTAAPIGLYMCSYWIILNAITRFRDTLSWRHLTPWSVTMAASICFVLLFEMFVLLIRHEQSAYHWTFYLAQLGRVLISYAFGMTLAKYFIDYSVHEATST